MKYGTSGLPYVRAFGAAEDPVTLRESRVPGLHRRRIAVLALRLQYKTGSTSRGAHTQKTIEQRTLARECLHPRLLVRCRELFKVAGVRLQWTYEGVGRTWQGFYGGCLLNLHCTMRLASYAKGGRPEPTIFPHTKSNTNDLPLVSDMIHNGSHRQAHNGQRWHILGLTLVCFRERTDVLGSRNSCFDFAPGCLGEFHKQGIAWTVLE